MNIKELKEIIQLMQEHGLTELELEKNGLKIRLKKGNAGVEIKTSPISGFVASAPETIVPHSPAVAKEDQNVAIVHSPMVGTFYAAPAPDQEPYAAKGKVIKIGDVLCIVEAMKLMNEIKSEVNGRIVDILVENGQPVEFDQPLFKIQKT